jgi:hypothetical protein
MGKNNVFWIVMAAIFVSAALEHFFHSPNLRGINFGEIFFIVVRFIVFIGLFIAGAISLAKIKDWTASALCGIVAFATLLSS